MKILVLCYEYPPLGGGGGVAASQYAEAWVQAGHSVTVITGGGKGLPSRESVNGVHVIRVATPWRKERAITALRTMAAYNLLAFLYAIRHRKELRQATDVINTHFSIPTGPTAQVIAGLLKVPNVLTIIGGDIHDPTKPYSPHRSRILRFVNRWVIGKADYVIAISSDTQTRARRYYGIERDIEVINYGFKPVFSRIRAPKAPASGGVFRMISVGRLIPRKGFEYLIKAMKHLPPDHRLTIVGDGPLHETLNEMARSEGVAEAVHLVGYKTREQIHDLLQQSDCYVLSSIHEGLGIVVQEAMEAGLPVVATNDGGQVDLIHEPRNGILVPTEDPRAIAEAVRRIQGDPDLAREMADHNREDIAKLHIDDNCQRYIAVFSRVTAP